MGIDQSHPCPVPGISVFVFVAAVFRGRRIEAQTNTSAFDPDQSPAANRVHSFPMPNQNPYHRERRLPRYTSYPTAPHFGDAVNAPQGAGYAPVGHFARPDTPLGRAGAAGRLNRNFQGYTTDRADVLLGFGASAISMLHATAGLRAERTRRAHMGTYGGIGR